MSFPFNIIISSMCLMSVVLIHGLKLFILKVLRDIVSNQNVNWNT